MVNNQEIINQSWTIIPPYWPLENLIAVNPLQGLEDLPFEQALAEGAAYYQREDLPVEIDSINRESIKWCQAFFDKGQATLSMPRRELGLFSAWRQLAIWDSRLHQDRADQKEWLASLPESAEETINHCLDKIAIPEGQKMEFLRLMLTTLPGWAAFIKYKVDWSEVTTQDLYPVTKADFLALRLVVSCLLWPEVSKLLSWWEHVKKTGSDSNIVISRLETAEKNYRSPLLKKLSTSMEQIPSDKASPEAQFVFCIDVRSEPFRRALEMTGRYETYGFAGFFGLPVTIADQDTGETYASCPVLLKPQHVVTEFSSCDSLGCAKDLAGNQKLNLMTRSYQSVKYTFSTPFALVETIGPLSGLWMAIRTFFPKYSAYLENSVIHGLRLDLPKDSDISNIDFTDQCSYAEGALRMIGLTRSFAPIVVFCGHGSATQNNAYMTALDCGACGGRHGGSNARILAKILNDRTVRKNLVEKGIIIPDDTKFLAAEHNTTTDELKLFEMEDLVHPKLKADLIKAIHKNNQVRNTQMASLKDEHRSCALVKQRSQDWAQVRPEWGLARNASFIVGPRSLTEDIDLEGRAFLHSYNWEEDADGALLTTILTAPMVVAQWINCQYLFSTLDNVAYGGGSKITKNITGKIGVMQGNGSDLMNGLPLQSLFRDDLTPYHEALRLLTVVYAPRDQLTRIIKQQEVLQKLFGNGWVSLACLDPSDGQIYGLDRKFIWSEMF